MQNEPVYSIRIVAELLGVHPETIRVWERNDVIHPRRRGGRRIYSNYDIKKLRFIQRLMEEGLNLPAIRHYLLLYPCWKLDDCPGCMHRSEYKSCAKPCWKEEGVYCEVYGDVSACANCKLRKDNQSGNIEDMNSCI